MVSLVHVTAHLLLSSSFRRLFRPLCERRDPPPACLCVPQAVHPPFPSPSARGGKDAGSRRRRRLRKRHTETTLGPRKRSAPHPHGRMPRPHSARYTLAERVSPPRAPCAGRTGPHSYPPRARASRRSLHSRLRWGGRSVEQKIPWFFLVVHQLLRLLVSVGPTNVLERPMRRGHLTLPELTLNVALVHSDWSGLGSPSPSSRGTSARVFGANYTSSINVYRSPVSRRVR